MSNYADQSPYLPTIDTYFADAAFAENAEPRCPCLLLLDTSSSMSGRPISELNNALIAFKDELAADSLAAKRVEIGIVTFGPVRVAVEFQTADDFQPPTLSANGNTPMGAAIEQAITMLRERKETYKRNGVAYYRPWIFLITDGAPTDAWQRAAQLIREGEQAKGFLFYAVGVDEANFDILRQLSVRQPLRLKGMRYRDIFLWLSGSLSSVSQSTPGDLVPLNNPATPDGWASTE